MILETISPEETHELGKKIASICEPGDVILLQGTLGAGKTCLTQGIAEGLGIDGPVRSPTFILVNEHHGKYILYHIDLYRLSDIAEIETLGLDEYFQGDGITVVEWPERAPFLFSFNHLSILLEHYGELKRRVVLEGIGDRHTDFIKAVSTWK
jgi:tRNA threonylcarbamoyladenosine biosynthesis protein TsaE